MADDKGMSHEFTEGSGILTETDDVETFIIHKVTGMEESEIESLIKDIQPMSQSKATEMAEEVASKIADIVHQYRNG